MNTIPGIVRAICMDNSDPQNLRRIKVQAPGLWGGSTSGWAAACGNQIVPPSVGEPVYIMFEMGNPNYPVWIGTASPVVNPVQLSPATAPQTYTVTGSATSAAFISALEEEVGQQAIYVTYGTGPGNTPSGGFDCSGLIQYCLEQAGLSGVPRTSEAQYAWCKGAGTLITAKELVPGSLIFQQWPGDDYAPGHVIAYVGTGTSYPQYNVIQSHGITGTLVTYYAWSPVPQDYAFAKVPGLTY